MKGSGEHLVSVVMPVYNSASTLLESVNSVLNQTHSNLELILVDDFSKDDSWKIISELLKVDDRIKAIKLDQNSGAAKARNEAIAEAKGRFIAFLDADDLWVNAKLEKQIQFSLEVGAGITHTSYKWIDKNGAELSKVISVKPKLTYVNMLNYNHIGCLTAMYDIDVLGSKFFMPDIRKRQDYALWLRILREGHCAYGLNEVLAFYRIGDDSLSSNKWDAARYNFMLLREIEGFSFPRATYHFFRYFLIGIHKHFFS